MSNSLDHTNRLLHVTEREEAVWVSRGIQMTCVLSPGSQHADSHTRSNISLLQR